MERTAAERLVKTRGWLARQTAEFQKAILSEAEFRRMKAGEFTFHMGDESGGIYCAASGSFGILIENAADGVVLAHVVRPGVWFGEGPTLTGRPRTLSFRAMEPSTVLYLPLPSVQEISRKMPEAGRIFGSLAENNIDIAVEALSSLLIRRSDQRIAAVLLRVSDDVSGGSPTGDRIVNLSQADLSQMANSSRHVVNAVLSDFAGRGWVETGYRHMVIHDRRALERFVSGG